MLFPRVVFAIGVVLCVVTVAWSGESRKVKKAKEGTRENRAEMVVHLTPDGKNKGLLLTYPKTISASSVTAGKPVTFPILIVNLLEEEVFVEVTHYDHLSYDLRFDAYNFASGGGVGSSADNRRLLKRLHACWYKGGKPSPSDRAAADISGKVDFAGAMPLSDFIGAKATIGFPLRGFYRTNGKEFTKDVEMPVEIVK
jgi:hypothetical protein